MSKEEEEAKEFIKEFLKWTFETEYLDPQDLGVESINYEGEFSFICAKNCALISIEKILKVIPRYYKEVVEDRNGWKVVRIENCTFMRYQKLKEEIQKIERL